MNGIRKLWLTSVFIVVCVVAFTYIFPLVGTKVVAYFTGAGFVPPEQWLFAFITALSLSCGVVVASSLIYASGALLNRQRTPRAAAKAASR